MRSSILNQKRAKSLRRNLTHPEQTLWSLLRRNQLGLHFRRQHALGPFILDFYCASASLCVEVDGPAPRGGPPGRNQSPLTGCPVQATDGRELPASRRRATISRIEKRIALNIGKADTVNGRTPEAV